jgi:hypothetical protein
MVADYGITEGDAHVLTSPLLADQFESAAKAAKNPKRVANLVQSELLGRLKAQRLESTSLPISMKGWSAPPPIWSSPAPSPARCSKISTTSASNAAKISRRLRRRRPPRSNHRHVGARKNHRRSDRRQSQAARTIPRRQNHHARLLRRPGHESLQRPSLPRTNTLVIWLAIPQLAVATLDSPPPPSHTTFPNLLSSAAAS